LKIAELASETLCCFKHFDDRQSPRK